MSRSKIHVRKDDTVMVIAGKEKGKTGKIMKVIPKKQRVIIEKVNLIKRHKRASQTSKGGVVEREGSVHASNVLIYCKKCGSPVRIKEKFLDDGEKVRACIKCEEILDK